MQNDILMFLLCRNANVLSTIFNRYEHSILILGHMLTLCSQWRSQNAEKSTHFNALETEIKIVFYFLPYKNLY